MQLLDSSVWIAYFAQGQYADKYEKVIRDTTQLLISPINLYEVFRRVLQQRDGDAASGAIAVMLEGRVLDIDSQLALEAVMLAQQYHLALADSILLATARAYAAELSTQDAHFMDIPGVRYSPKVGTSQ